VQLQARSLGLAGAVHEYLCGNGRIETDRWLGEPIDEMTRQTKSEKKRRNQ
jgi:hypothetical protein